MAGKKPTTQKKGKGRTNRKSGHVKRGNRRLSFPATDGKGVHPRDNGGFKHNNPHGNHKRKRHKTLHDVQGTRKVVSCPKGKTPTQQNMVPWIQYPRAATPVYYAAVLRELLEGTRESPVLGEPQIDLHGDWASVESILTETPRLRFDYRAVVSILRILAGEGLVTLSFVEKVFNRHPVIGGRKVAWKIDTDLKDDIIYSRDKKPSKKVCKEASESWKKQIGKARQAITQKHMDEIRQSTPDISDEHCQSIANGMVAKEKIGITYTNDDGVTEVIRNKKDFVQRFILKRANKEANTCPTLFRLEGPSHKTVHGKDGKIMTTGDFVNIEIAVKKGKVVFLQNVYNKGGSPFRHMYMRNIERRPTSVTNAKANKRYIYVDEFDNDEATDGMNRTRRIIRGRSLDTERTIGSAMMDESGIRRSRVVIKDQSDFWKLKQGLITVDDYEKKSKFEKKSDTSKRAKRPKAIKLGTTRAGPRLEKRLSSDEEE